MYSSSKKILCSLSEQVSYKCKIPEQAILVTPKVSTESKMSKPTETSSTSDATDVILSKAECDALEKLFDRLVESRCSDDTLSSVVKRSVTESSIGSTVDNDGVGVDNDDGVQGDASSDVEETTENVEKLSKLKIQLKTEARSSSQGPMLKNFFVFIDATSGINLINALQSSFMTIELY